MTEAQIKYMTERFLGWKLPENFQPDNGISFKPTFNDTPEIMKMLGITEPMRHDPSGTNLLNYDQARDMVRYILEGLPLADIPNAV